jgi:hypothetical protein
MKPSSQGDAKNRPAPVSREIGDNYDWELKPFRLVNGQQRHRAGTFGLQGRIALSDLLLPGDFIQILDECGELRGPSPREIVRQIHDLGFARGAINDRGALGRADLCEKRNIGVGGARRAPVHQRPVARLARQMPLDRARQHARRGRGQHHTRGPVAREAIALRPQLAHGVPGRRRRQPGLGAQSRTRHGRRRGCQGRPHRVIGGHGFRQANTSQIQ